MKVQRVTFPVTSVALLLLACHGGPGGKSDAGGGGGGGGDDGGGAGATGWGSGTMISDAGAYTYQGINLHYNASTNFPGPYILPHYKLHGCRHISFYSVGH